MTMLGEAMVLLGAAIAVTLLFHRLRLGPVLGYLAAGVALGPYGAKLVSVNEESRAFAEMGVVFLLFLIGLELSLDRVRVMRRAIFGLGTVQLASCGIVFTLAGLALGLPPVSAAIIGFAVALSSTAIVLQLLTERGELAKRSGRASLGILLLQDLAVAPLLVLVTLAAGAGDLATIGVAAAKAVGAIVAIVGAGLLILPRLLKIVAETKRAEAFTAAALLAALAAAWATEQAGLSMALGAFLGGLVLANSAFRHQIESDIRPFEGLLLGLFFALIGAGIELSVVAARPAEVIGAALAVIVIKALLITAAARLSGIHRADAWRIGLLLAQAGEFAFVLLGLASQLEIIDRPIGQIVIAAVAISMVLTPFLDVGGQYLSHRLRRRPDGKVLIELAEQSEGLSGHVIIAGFGRVGGTVSKLLEDEGLPWLALDLDMQAVALARAAGRPIFYADASRRRALAAAGLERARVLVITIDDRHAAEATVHAARAVAPNVAILARARDFDHSAALGKAGATDTVPEAIEASLQLAAQVLRESAVTPERIDGALERLRHDNYSALRGPGRQAD